MAIANHECGLTPQQLEAAKNVYAALRAAKESGVNFFDNYGTLECYNAKRITQPSTVQGLYSVKENNCTYSEKVVNYTSLQKLSDDKKPPLLFNPI